jgi:type IX secretion system PorP/SprF family membrane protein
MKLHLLIPGLLLCFTAAAQQEQMYTMFMFNKLGYNPGFAGNFESPTLTAVYRNQWIGFDGAPKTQALSYSQQILGRRVGLGANLVNNTIGINKSITLDFAYAYRIEFKRGNLGVGLQASMRNFSQNWNDPRLVASQGLTTDDAIPQDPKSKLIANFGFGLYYTGMKGTKEKWYFGVAVPRIVSNSIDFSENGREPSREVPHFNAMGGVHFYMADDAIFTPQVLLKYTKNTPLDADINVSMLLYHKFYGGITYRTGGDTKGLGESVDVMPGFQATKNLFFSLSYDIGLTRIRKYSNGSVEAVVRWYFNPPEGTGKSTTPNL